MRGILVTVTFLVLILGGCKKQAACDPADSPSVCKGFQDCLRSNTSTEVCRLAEQDANKSDKQSPLKH
jgi:uncharacterized protein YgiB involved in biofilm formation